MTKLASQIDCSGCMACVDACSQGAIISVRKEDGHLYPNVDEQKCINCGLCESVCPILSCLEYVREGESSAYAVWAKDSEARKKSASGGAFVALAQYIIAKGGVVYGAMMSPNFGVHHICVDSLENLALLQGSKYLQSDTSGIYKDVYSRLNKGQLVLFSGTGCQVAGLYSYLQKKKYEGVLYTVDLICGGVPSYLLVKTFCSNESYEPNHIISFRDKSSGWSPHGYAYNLKVEDNTGRIHSYENKRNLITDGFACQMTNRYSCYFCRFAGTSRMSDFTIGDYWGIRNYENEYYDGVSALAVHSEKGEKLLYDIGDHMTLNEASIQDILQGNPRLSKIKDYRCFLPERKFIVWAFKHLNYKLLCKIYALDFGKYSPWLLFKLYRYISYKLLVRK